MKERTEANASPRFTPRTAFEWHRRSREMTRHATCGCYHVTRCRLIDSRQRGAGFPPRLQAVDHLVLIKLLFPIFLLFPFANAAWDLSAPQCDYAEQPFPPIPRDSLYQKPYTPRHQRTAQLELALKRARCFQKAE
jgi:hypothetical protein